MQDNKARTFYPGEIPKNADITCECGKQLDFVKSAYESQYKRVCPNCGRINYVDESPIDWARVYKNENKAKQ